MLEKMIQLVMRQRIMILLFTAVVMIAGVYSWQTIEIDAFPDATNVQVMILVEAPGLATVDVEQQITYPIESNMGGLPNVKQVRSLSKAGLAQVVVIFEDFVDIYFARQVVGERLIAAKESLPEGIEPELGPVSTGLGEIYQYTLESSTHTPMELRTIQDWVIAPQLRTIQGVTEINSFGGFVKQFHVLVKPDMLLKYGISLSQVFEAVEKNNANAGGSYILHGWEQSYVRSVGLFTGISDIEKIVLKAKDGTPVLLKDVADVEIGPETRQGAVTRDGKGESVAGMVIMLKGANSKDVVDRVKKKIPEIQANLQKEGVKLNTFYDRTSLIQACVDTVSSSLLEGGILVIIVLFIFLWDFRSGLVIALSLPVSVLMTFIMMRWAGISANLMTLGGMAIALGKVADAGIIVTENIVRHMAEETKEPVTKLKRIENALKEVAGPITFAMLIIIIVFSPLFALQQIEGKMFKPLAVTNTLLLVAALFTGLFIIPVLCYYLLKEGKETKSFLMRIIERIYQPVLRWAMGHAAVLVVVAVAMLGGSLYLLSKMGTEFIPQLDEGSIAINIVRLPSASLEGSKTVASEIEKRLVKIPEVTAVVSKTGRAEISEDPMGPEQTDVCIMLKNKKEWRSGITKQDLVKEISEEIDKMPGLRASFSQPIALRVNELISGVKSDVAVKIFGDDIDLLQKAGAQVSEVLSATKGAVDVKLEQVSGFFQLNVEINRADIARHGINVSDINDVIETAVGGKTATRLVEGRTSFAVVVRFPYESRKDIAALEGMLIPSPSGYMVPLGHLAKLTESESPAQVSHENSMRRIVVECNLRDRDSGSFIKEIQEKIKPIEKTLPTGYIIEYGGQFENQQRAQKTLSYIVPISILLILLLLFMSFGSIRNAILVILNVPFALVGGIFALYISGQYLSVPSSIGFIALFGVAMLDGIVLISYVQLLGENGMGVKDAIMKGAALRLRPILMTAAVAIVGLIPLLSATGPGAEIQRPLATVGIGGLITSTLLTLIVLPAIYPWFQKKQ
jgi:cobalt-zinc-cadmium resistance protein CzcA